MSQKANEVNLQQTLYIFGKLALHVQDRLMTNISPTQLLTVTEKVEKVEAAIENTLLEQAKEHGIEIVMQALTELIIATVSDAIPEPAREAV